MIFEPARFRADIPCERWLREKLEMVEEDGRNRFGVPNRMGPVTGTFSRNLRLPVSLLARCPGERGEQLAPREESLEYIRANWQTTSSYPPFIEIDPYGKAYVSEGNHRIMVAKERREPYLEVEIRYFSGGQRKAGDFSPDSLLMLDAIATASMIYQEANAEVDGREVLGNVPNTSSISASFDRYEVLSGLREVPLLDFDAVRFATVDDQKRTEVLADKIKESGKISPLIVVLDADGPGPYVLEGGHRLAALQMIEAKSFPAMVVLDTESILRTDAIQSVSSKPRFQP